MEKTHIHFWLIKPSGDFRKFLITAKIVILLLICGLALPATSMASGNPSADDQQQIKVSGKVTDITTGEAMPGVNILIKGTMLGAISDKDGNYSINVSDKNASLVFSFLGYVSLEVPLNGRSIIDVTLESELQQLQEVVVVGYGTTPKASLTGSINAVRGSELKQSPATNYTNTIIGRIPGITAIQKTGEPGSDAATITIRGNNTLGDNTPLIVIDGIPHRSLDRLDPSDIETFTVLKDASAAIYGTQAANGVILVTTKRGQIGKPTITVNLNAGYNQPTVIPKMADAATYATCLNEIAYYAAPSNGRNQIYSDADIKQFADGSDPWGHPNTDWYKEVFKTWSRQSYNNISVSGGTESMKYFLSFGTKFEDAFYKNSATNFRQYDFRSNIDGKVSKNLSIAFDVGGRQENYNHPTVGVGDIFRMIQRGKPNMQAWWPNGYAGPDIEYGYNSAVTVTNATGFNHDIFYYLETNLRAVVTVPWVKGLSVQANGSYDKVFRFDKLFVTPWTLYQWDGIHKDASGLTPVLRGPDSHPMLTENWQDGVRKTFNAFATYETTLAAKNHIRLMVGTEAQSGLNNFGYEYRKNFVSSAIPQLFAGAADSYMNANGYASQNARLSYFGRFNYDYSQKYLVEVVLRYDGSYMFKPGKQFGFFPGISLGWRVSEENFWKNNINFISEFKLRASWGQTGNDRIYYNGALKEYQYLSTYSYDASNIDYIFGQNVANKMLYENVVPNPNVTWEVANESNIGFDATLLDKKLTVNADFFYNLRTKILWQSSAIVPVTTGMTLPPQNIGKVSNIGFEYIITYHGIAGDFGYNLSINGSYAKNKVVFSYDTPGIPEYQKSEGKPMYAQLAYQTIGVFKDDAAVAAYPHIAGAQPGDLIFEDVDGNNVINQLDMVRDSKNTVPRFIGGFNASFTYKGFDLSMLFQGAAGAIDYLNPEVGNIGDYYNDWVKNRWTPENTDASWPRCWDRSNEYWSPGSQRNTFWEFNNDYIRLKNLELGYSLPPSITKKLTIQKLRVYLSGQNLFTLTKLKVADPEVSGSQTYPLLRVVNLGLTLTF